MIPTRPPAFDPTGPLPLGVTLIEASAGTGKTYSITSIVLRLVIEEGIPVERICAVTFTRAATAELTSRIRKRLGEAWDALTRHPTTFPRDPVIAHLVARAASAPPGELAARARRAVETFDRAQISTIHGFCQTMLQQHALEAQVPFGVQLVEDQLAIHAEIAADFWARELVRLEPFELQLLELSGLDLEAVTRLTTLAITQWEAEPTPDVPAAVRPDSTALLDALTEASSLARHPDAAELARELLLPLGTRQRDIEATLSALDALANGLPTEQDRLALRKTLHADALRRPHALLPPLVQALTRLLDAYEHWRPLGLRWVLSLRRAIVDHARAEHITRTRGRGLWCFDDLLRRMLEALRSPDPAVSRALEETVGGRFDAVLIDEFQDTDPVQWGIFEHLFATPRHRLFLIGDPKQAIYSFRRADVNTYIAARARADRVATLHENRRSDPPLIAALNAFFSRRDTASTAFANPEIPYQAFSPPRRPAPDPAPPPRVPGLGAPLRFVWIDRTKKNAGSARFGHETGRIASAWGEAELPTLVADDIVATLESGLRVASDDGERRLLPSDCAVLVPRNKQASAIQAALRKVGVPSVVHGPYSVFSTEEARELELVLTAILDPSHLRNVRRALLTRVIGVTALELSHMDREDPAALEAWFDRFRQWRETWNKRSFIEGFRRLLSHRVEALLALEDGERRLANLLQLGELIHLTATERGLKAPGVLSWYQRQLSHGDDSDRHQVRLETDEPAVQITTIHKAKGLEYPFVWCPFLWQAPIDTARFRPTEEFVVREGSRSTLELGLDPDAPERQRHLALKRYETRTEHLRQLYVALTRARHRVTIHLGAFWDLPGSALGYLAFTNARATDAPSLERELSAISRLASTRDGPLKSRLVADLDPSLVSVESAVPPRTARLEQAPDPTPLLARPWDPDRVIDTHWRRTSFSGLAVELANSSPSHEHRSDGHRHDEDHLQAATDEDRSETFAAFPTPAQLPILAPRRVRLADMPSGRMIGNCIHKIFELLDFRDTDQAALLTLVEAELLHFGLDKAHAPALAEAVRDVVSTPLDASGFTLSELAPTERLNELDFVFPTREAPGFELSDLVAAFREHGDRHLDPWLDQLQGAELRTVRGFLSGSIDLAFRHPRDGRFWVLDWKSNHLGDTAEDYRREPMRRAMDHHHYHLQCHLYSVALSRYLRHRLPSFSLERDFGGVLYLFIRGISPEHPPLTGVWVDRPSPALIRALDAALAAPTAAQASAPT